MHSHDHHHHQSFTRYLTVIFALGLMFASIQCQYGSEGPGAESSSVHKDQGSAQFDGISGCIGQLGLGVDWWVVIKFPGGEECAALDDQALSACEDRATASAQPIDIPRQLVVANYRPSQSYSRLSPASLRAQRILQQHDSRHGAFGEASDRQQPGSKQHQQSGKQSQASSCWSIGLNVNNNSALQQTLNLLVPPPSQHPHSNHHSSNLSSLSSGVLGVGDMQGRGLSQGAINPVRGRGRMDTRVLGSRNDDRNQRVWGHLMYNDEDPYSTHDHQSSAHAKGVLAFSAMFTSPGVFDTKSVSGFWVTHSIPKFPFANSSQPGWNHVQPSQTLYGQHALCISLSAAGIDAVASSLLTSRAFVYNHSTAALGPVIQAQLPSVQRLLDGHFTTTHEVYDSPLAVSENSSSLPSTWRLLSKPPVLAVPFYEAVLEPRLNTSMQWQTWQRGAGGRLPSTCPPCSLYPFSSLNIRILGLHAAGVIWPSLSDHSKWGISLPSVLYPGGAGVDAGYGVSSSTSLHPVTGSSVHPDKSSSRIQTDIQSSKRATLARHSHSTPSSSSSIRLSSGLAREGLDNRSWEQVTCFGDLNRENSQRLRGGGAVCAKVPGLWREMVQLVQLVEMCSGV